MCSTRLGATADQPEGHALREPQETTTIDGAKAADSSTEQELSNVATLDTPVAAVVAAAAAADSAEGRSSEVGGEGGVEQAPTMAAVGQVDSPAVGGGQSREEEEVMAELLAQQPGGPEENEGGGEDEGGAKPMVRAGVFLCFVTLRVIPMFKFQKRVLRENSFLFSTHENGVCWVALWPLDYSGQSIPITTLPRPCQVQL